MKTRDLNVMDRQKKMYAILMFVKHICDEDIMNGFYGFTHGLTRRLTRGLTRGLTRTKLI